MRDTWITVPVTVEEREALKMLARKELRDPRSQARHLLQQVLYNEGLLPSKDEDESSNGVSQDMAVAAP